MTRHIDLDNPTDEQRFIVEMYEVVCAERDAIAAKLAEVTRERDAMRPVVAAAKSALAHRRSSAYFTEAGQREQFALDIEIDKATDRAANALLAESEAAK